jgi:hypothetical protein
VDGKADGWYPYTAEGSASTESLWATYQANPSMGTRVVHSGYFDYWVDLQAMTQRNLSSGKQRRIRRATELGN